MLEYPKTTYWRTKCMENGYIGNWDGEWFYHFRLAGYATIEWLEIKCDPDEIKHDIVRILRKIHVPGEFLDDKVRVYGYKKDGFIDYL